MIVLLCDLKGRFTIRRMTAQQFAVFHAGSLFLSHDHRGSPWFMGSEGSYTFRPEV